jgi:hypothetical protein
MDEKTVSVEWLKKWCLKNHKWEADYAFVFIEDLLCAVEKEANKNG